MRFAEICCGIGGTRMGLERLGWKCVYSCDLDWAAVKVHRLAFGDCELKDALDLLPESLPKAEVLVAGFPCQPFSSSGNRLGFQHRRGNVFYAIEEIIKARRPRFVLLENVKGLLSNRQGHSMACILQALTAANYYAEWALVNARSLGLPQDRPRLFIVAVDTLAEPKLNKASRLLNANHSIADQAILLRPIFNKLITSDYHTETGSLANIIETRAPRVGVPVHSGPIPFLASGLASGDHYVTQKIGIIQSKRLYKPLARICSRKFTQSEAIRSVRYWGHTGITKPYRKQEPISHCIGTNIGAGPTFCVPEAAINGDEQTLLTHFSNWSRRQSGLFIFRLTPERALQLFDNNPRTLVRALRVSGLGITKQYELLGNMVAPEVARVVGKCLEDYTKHSDRIFKRPKENIEPLCLRRGLKPEHAQELQSRKGNYGKT